MRKLLVYSHDTFGMGNIRRMLALSEYLIETTPDISILLITGSPVIHELRLPERLDYIKLPSLTRTTANVYCAKTLGTGIEETMRLRADLILAAAANFQPDLVLVDKKPCGVKNELARTLEWLKTQSNARIALVLRDILDSPENTIPIWNSQRYSERIASYYDKVFVLGVPEIFDPRVEYAFPAAVSAKTVFCGYIGKRRAAASRAAIRQQLGVAPDERLVLVTIGGGEDGHPIIQTYCAALAEIHRLGRVRSLIITGPEMPAPQRDMVSSTMAGNPRVTCRTFVDNMMAYMEAADLIVSMGGYNTVCELLSAQKRGIVIPRAEPVAEQWIRAERMARLGLFSVIHPRDLTPTVLANAVTAELAASAEARVTTGRLDLGALANISRWCHRLLPEYLEGVGLIAGAASRNGHRHSVGVE
jgi:predicted glycosyltransferase